MEVSKQKMQGLPALPLKKEGEGTDGQSPKAQGGEEEDKDVKILSKSPQQRPFMLLSNMRH